MNEDTNAIQEPAQVKKIDAFGLRIFGKDFKGFTSAHDCVEFLGRFKEFYYQERGLDPKISMNGCIKKFNATILKNQEKMFYPRPDFINGQKKKWEKDLIKEKEERMERARLEQAGRLDIIEFEREEKKKHKISIVDLAKGRTNNLTPENAMEAGIHTLGEMLLNDAASMMFHMSENDDFGESEMSLKRRNYAVNVFSHATRLVHGKAALALKASEEKRNNAGFLMGLLAKATAGTISSDEIGLLKSTYPKKEEPITAEIIT